MKYKNIRKNQFCSETLHRRFLFSILLFCTAGLRFAPADVVPLDSSMTVEVSTTVSPHPESYITVTDEDSQDGEILPLHIYAQAIDSALSNISDATVDGWARWINPGQGKACIITHWIASTQEPAGQDSGGAYSSEQIFICSFMPDQDGIFKVNFDIMATGTSTFSFWWAYDFFFDGSYYNLDLPNENPANLSTSFSFPVYADTEYTLDVRGYPNVGSTYLFDNELATVEILFQFIPTPQACGDPGTTYQEADLNHDCYVNLQDLLLFAPQWLTCTDPSDSSCD